MRFGTAVGVTLIATAGLATAGQAQAPSRSVFDEKLLQAFTYRNIGPFRMGARTADVAVPDSPAKEHRNTIYAGFWNGGVFKTTNAGTTWEPIFDEGHTKLAIGDIAISPSNPNIVWVGTGDAFVSRSSYRGDGIYKSTDAGRTWTNMRLPGSSHIARIVIHPTNPNIVFVAELGQLYSENPDRGVYRTMNGGQSWEKVFYINEKIGMVDLVMNPKDPNILYVAAYDKKRLPWQMVNGGPESAIYKTTDAGKSWNKLAGGLPTGRIGRIGLDIYPKNPDILYAIIENANPPQTGQQGAPGDNPGTVGGELYRTENGGQTWTKTHGSDHNAMPKGPYYFTQVRVDPNNDKVVILTGEPFLKTTDGGKTWNRIFPRMFGDFRTLWIDPEDSDRIIIGSDGGIAVSYDGGRTSTHLANIPVGEIYQISADMDDPYNVYIGLQDHEHWRGPSNGPLGRVTPNDWYAIGDNDGIYATVDPTNSRWAYTTRQYGGQTRVDQLHGYETVIQPPQRPQGQQPHRFHWNTPVHISPHNPATIYLGSQVLLKSTNRGDTWTEISPDLSTNDQSKIGRQSETGVPGWIPWFAISTIAESPLTRGVIWVGTSDGKVQLTRNDGGSWTDMTPKLTALGARVDGYVARVRASAHAPGRAYVAKSGYKYDDWKPYLYTTDDYGATWRSIAGNLPDEPLNVVFEDPKNPDLLYVGNDIGVFVTINRGRTWARMNNNMPHVPVHDLTVHPRENDLILGTYGRQVWIASNIGALQEMTEAVLDKDVHLFSIKPTVQRITWSFGANDYLFGQAHLQTPNEPNAMIIRYYLKNAVSTPPTVVVTNAQGQEMARLQGTGTPGVNTVQWNMRPQAGGRGAGPGAGRGGGGGRGTSGPPSANWVPLGDYTITLDVGGRKHTQTGKITKTQGWSLAPNTQTIR